MSAVSIENVVKRFGEVEVIHGLSLDVTPGEFVVFVGPSGCGKSTLLRMIAGLESFQSGRVSIGGKLVNDLPARDRDIAMVFQEYALYPHMSVEGNMGFGLRMRGTDRAEIKTRVGDAARILQIEHLLHRRPRELSGGQRQRVAMGRAIVRNPQVFLFDEPLSNLDAKLRIDMRSEIKRLHQRLGATMIYVTHDQVEAMTMADRIVILNAGRIEQIGTPQQVYRDPASRFVASFIGSPSMNVLDAEVAGDDLVIGDGWRLPGAAGGLATARIALGIRPEHIVQSVSGLPLHVEIVEPLGADVLVSGNIAGQPVVARFPGEVDVRPGTALTVALQPSQLRFFDPVSGARVHPREGASPAAA